MGEKALVVMCRIAWGTSRREGSWRVCRRPASGRRVVGSEEVGEVSSSESEGWFWSLEELLPLLRWMGLRRGREEKGDRRAVVGVDFLMRLECAAVVWKDIVCVARGGSRRIKECDVDQRGRRNHGRRKKKREEERDL
jgi:hypothetical protein